MRIVVVVNPASGQDEPVLAKLNRGFGSAIDWDVIVTHEGRDEEAGERVRAANADLIAVYGGDGTVCRIVSVLGDSDTPIAVLPGGTANALADYLGANADLEELAERLAQGRYSVRRYDAGRLHDRTFLLRASIGLVAGFTHHADRELKDRFGILAYAVSTLHALRESAPIRYRLTLDGHTEEQDAVACIIANLGGTGLGLPPVGQFDAHDARLDVVLVPGAVRGLTQLLANAAQALELASGFPRWTARKVRVETAEPQPVHIDGEPGGETPVTLRARANAVRLVSFADARPNPSLTDAEELSVRSA
jgi:diacylglycerol kinase family enzyme